MIHTKWTIILFIVRDIKENEYVVHANNEVKEIQK